MRHIFLILLTFALLGCTRKDLYYGALSHPGRIIISANWNDTKNIPGGIVAYLYQEGGATKSDSTKHSIEYIPNMGSTVALPYGSYYGLIFNDYTEEILFRNMDQHQLAEAYLKRSEEAPFFTRNPETKQIGNLESFYITQIETFTLTVDSRSHSTTINPKLTTLKIDLIIPLEGGDNIAYAKGTLSGVYDAINLSTGSPNRENIANVVFDFNILGNIISASVTCFGINNFSSIDNSNIGTIIKNNLEIAFILKDGSQIIGEHIFDITDIIIENAPTESDNGAYEDIIIKLDELGIIIPDVNTQPGEGFDIKVYDWDNTIIKEL